MSLDFSTETTDRFVTDQIFELENTVSDINFVDRLANATDFCKEIVKVRLEFFANLKVEVNCKCMSVMIHVWNIDLASK